MTDELVNIQEIADLYRCSYNTARDQKVKMIGFPEPVPGSSVRKPLWLRSEVRAFLHRRTPAQTKASPSHA